MKDTAERCCPVEYDPKLLIVIPDEINSSVLKISSATARK